MVQSELWVQRDVVVKEFAQFSVVDADDFFFL
jgi:hypothetical protein